MNNTFELKKNNISSKAVASSTNEPPKTSNVSVGLEILISIDVVVRCLWRDGPPRSKLYSFIKDSDATHISECAPNLLKKRVVYKELNRIDPPKCSKEKLKNYPEPTDEQLECQCWDIGLTLDLQIMQYLKAWFEAIFDYSDNVAELISYGDYLEAWRRLEVFGIENFVPLAKYYTAYPMAKFLKNQVPVKPVFLKTGPYLFPGRLKRFLKARTVSNNNSAAKLCWTILQGIKRGTETVPVEYVQVSLEKHQKAMSKVLPSSNWETNQSFEEKADKVLRKFFCKRVELFEGSTSASFTAKRNEGGQREEILQMVNDSKGLRMTKMIEVSTTSVETVNRPSSGPLVTEIISLLPVIHSDPEHKGPRFHDYVQGTIDPYNFKTIEEFFSKEEFLRPSFMDIDCSKYSDSKDTEFQELRNEVEDLQYWYKIKNMTMSYEERLSKMKPIIVYLNNYSSWDKTTQAASSTAIKQVRKRISDKKEREDEIERLNELSDLELIRLVFPDKLEAFTLLRDWLIISEQIFMENYELKEVQGLSIGFFKPYLLQVNVVPVLEPLKVRLITTGESLQYYLSKFFQIKMHTYLRKLKPFQLIGKPLSVESLQWLSKSSVDFERKFGVKWDFWVSGDYSAATDNISLEYTKTVFESFLRKARLSHKVKTALRQVLYSQVCVYSDKSGIDVTLQANGQLMGSPLSFPILCMINFLAYWISLEEYLRSTGFWDDNNSMEVTFEDIASLINGDDILFRSNQQHYNIWLRVIREVGFELSVGKNYCSDEYLTVNSELYSAKLIKGGLFEFKKIDYFNVGLLMGMSKLNSERDKKQPKPLWDTYNLVMKGATNKIRAHRRFFHYNIETIKINTNDGEFNVFANQLLGGLGFDLYPGIYPNFTSFQFKLGSFLIQRSLKRVEDRNVRTSRFYKGIVAKNTRLTEPLISKFVRIQPLLGEGPLNQGESVYVNPQGKEDILTQSYNFDAPVFTVKQIGGKILKQFRKSKGIPMITDEQLINFPVRFIKQSAVVVDDKVILHPSSSAGALPLEEFKKEFDLKDYEDEEEESKKEDNFEIVIEKGESEIPWSLKTLGEQRRLYLIAKATHEESMILNSGIDVFSIESSESDSDDD